MASKKAKKLRRKFRREHGRDPKKAGLNFWYGIFSFAERMRYNISTVLLTPRIKAKVIQRVPMGVIESFRFWLAARVLGRNMLGKIKKHQPTAIKDEFRQYKKKHL